ncbi:hypothetical protein [Neomegalonema perideroedes]|uniref:hypothetical protein n=1 Tax=Neomegalonema perideroedes TaxID=217219 RepID=UPI00036B2166|nr:hypothetical protein [Neomegalonema perideroedes]
MSGPVFGSLSGGARAAFLGLALTSSGGAPAARAQTEDQARRLAEMVATLGGGRIGRSRGGFVAGHVAGGFLTVVGPDQPILKGRYRFEDFALVVQGEDGREDRVFFGVPEGEDLSDPDEAVIGGEIYWTRKE